MYARRITLFLASNLAVVLLLGLVLHALGVDAALARRGVPTGGLLALAALLGFGGAFVSLALSKWMAKLSTGAEVITHPRTRLEAWLLDTVRRQAEQVGIGMPEVAIFPSDDPNAFATGMRRDAALVAVSTGLLERMEPREVEAVLAHEVSHVANGDMVTMALLQGVLNTFVVFLARVVGFAVDAALRGRDDQERSHGPGIGYFLTVIVLEIVLGLVASIIALWYSRRREFRADRGAAELVGAGPMISALDALRRAHEPGALPKELTAFGIRDGGPGVLGRLFLSHPPIEERIAALETLAPRRPARFARAA